MVVLDIGFAPWKATLLGTFFDVDKALKDNFLGIMLEIWEHASTQTELDEAVKSQIHFHLSMKDAVGDGAGLAHVAVIEALQKEEKSMLANAPAISEGRAIGEDTEKAKSQAEAGPIAPIAEGQPSEMPDEAREQAEQDVEVEEEEAEMEEEKEEAEEQEQPEVEEDE
ncbi:unnamed protein product, partial [Symbiodinium necroappetens]